MFSRLLFANKYAKQNRFQATTLVVKMSLLNISQEKYFSIPHDGYHWNRVTANYFEGWYFRLTLPKIKQTFAFMYSIQDPLGNKPNSGGAVQILGIDETYLCRTINNTDRFFAARNNLCFGHWGKTNLADKPRLLSSQQFARHITEGYQATAYLNQGSIYDPARKEYCSWEYQIEPVYGWGNSQQPQQSTAGLLSYLPIFEPGWQITSAHGFATGWVKWRGKRYEFHRATAYSEKNWGSSFPQKWFWLNCNSFESESDLALTAGGGIRQVLWWEEEVALIGIHYQGKFYEFAPWNSQVSWRIEPWGNWQMQAISSEFKAFLTGITDSVGTYVRTPTAKGLVFNCRDTTKGRLDLELKHHNGEVIVKASSDLPGLEVGGAPWNDVWQVAN